MSTWPPTPAPLTPVTYASFTAAFPEFANAAVYPQAAFDFFASRSCGDYECGNWGALYNFGYQYYIAHCLMLYKRRNDAAILKAYPGLAKGVLLLVNHRDRFRISYDTQASIEDRGGMYNETEYGKIFLRKARLVGAGPRYIGAGRSGGAGQVLSFMAWPGPPTGNGYSF